MIAWVRDRISAWRHRQLVDRNIRNTRAMVRSWLPEEERAHFDAALKTQERDVDD